MNQIDALNRWDLLNREITFRSEHTDLTQPAYFDGLFEALLEMCFVEEELGIAHLHNQREH